MSKVFRVALVAMKHSYIDNRASGAEKQGDINANLDRHQHWLAQAMSHEPDFVGFPEFSLTGWVQRPDAALSLDAPQLAAIDDMAKANNVFLSASFVERTGERLFNSCLMTGPQGRLGVMRKINLIPAEAEYYSPGDAFPVFDLAGVKMGVSTCADSTYYEMHSLLSYRGAEVIFAPHANSLGNYGNHASAWKRWRLENWPFHAKRCCVAIAGINNAGALAGRRDNDVTKFCGGGMVMDWHGKVNTAITGTHKRERLLVHDIDLGGLRAARAAHGPFKQFRPQIMYNRQEGFVHGRWRD